VEKRDPAKSVYVPVGTTADTATEFRVIRLVAGNEYVLRVSAENEVGVGEPAELSHGITAKSPYCEFNDFLPYIYICIVVVVVVVVIVVDVKKTFLRFFLFWSRFLRFSTFLILQTFFYFKKTLAKFRAASRLTRSTFKVTATKQTYDLCVE